MRLFLAGALLMVQAGAPFSHCADHAAASATHLAESITVDHSCIWLTDLLPPHTSPSLQKASAEIELGAAPQPGSLRVFRAEEIAQRLAGQPDLLSQLVVPSRIIVRYSGRPIRQETVREAISKFLRDQGWNSDLPDSATLEWLPTFTVATTDPALDVTGLEWDARQQAAQFRLRCSQREVCGSFVVHVVLPVSTSREWREHLRRTIASDSRSSPPTAAGPGPGPVLAKRGKPATLVLESQGMRISLPVICLQPGVLNQHIRVFDAQSRRVFHAEVVAEGMLRASL